jgi:hypothetical protein
MLIQIGRCDSELAIRLSEINIATFMAIFKMIPRSATETYFPNSMKLWRKLESNQRPGWNLYFNFYFSYLTYKFKIM